MPPGRVRVLAIMLIAVLAVSLGEALLSKGMKQSNMANGTPWAMVRHVLTDVHVLAGTALMAGYFGLYMLALRWADLSFVLPLTALSYLLGAMLSKYYLGESVTPVRWLGAVVITVGVAIVGLGDSGSPHAP